MICLYISALHCECFCVTLRLLQGVGRPDEVLACVEAGMDLFESFFPFQVTERGCALFFSFDISQDPERAGSAPPAGVVNSFVRTFCFEFYIREKIKQSQRKCNLTSVDIFP